MVEIWKPVIGYEGLYEVSNLGNIRNVVTNTLKKQTITNWGYLSVTLFKNNKGKTIKVHRIVMLAFVGEVSKDVEINHINEIKTDNRLTNLEYCTHEYNVNFGTRTSRVVASLSKPVVLISKNGERTKYPSCAEAAHSIGSESTAISQCARHLKYHNTVHGYQVEFVKEDEK